MAEVKTQIGISSECNFEENTWAFEMNGNYSVWAGKFAIVPLELYEDALQRIQIAIEAIGNNAEFAFLKDDLKSIHKQL